MANGSLNSRSILRMLFWEGLAVAGFIHTHFHPGLDPFWNRLFFFNSLFFLLAYPFLFLYRWIMTEGCLSTVLWPFSLLLNLGLGASCYLWMAYFSLNLDSPFYYAMKNHYIPLGILFAFVYFPLIQPFLGISKQYQGLFQLVGTLFYSTLGGIIGFGAGWFVSQRLPSVRSEGGHWFLFWLFLILLGVALGAFMGQRKASK